MANHSRWEPVERVKIVRGYVNPDMAKTKHIVDLKKDWPIALLVVGAIIAVGLYSGAFRGICTKIPIPLLCMSSERKQES